MEDDTEVRDADADADADGAESPAQQHIYGVLTEKELDEKYPNRPHNHSPTFPFHELILNLFNPLNDNKKKITGPTAARKRQGAQGSHPQTPHEARRSIIDRFVSRWRTDVGNDIYPALRLIIPEKDRDRAMYGLKEKTIGKLLVRVMKIDRNSEDGFNLLHWKLPGLGAAASMAGDFARRCFEVISKRPMRTDVGDMTIGEVNNLLDRLSVAQKEENQLPIFQELYQRMNAEELMWLIRMILRQMKVGATEKTIFEIWHPDASMLFNISSCLRRVCWELHDPSIRLEGDKTDIDLMQCFQPQLAQFQSNTFEKMVQRMHLPEEDRAFWIEEKLDGERMQLHMIEDSSTPGGKRFGFWSRKAKDYTYLYGSGLEDNDSALTRHLKDAFNVGVRSIILDGEMITWDPEQDKIVPFGTLKTAALAAQKNPFSNGERPLFRVFDILYLNDQALTKYMLRDRRQALEQSVNSVHRRMEIHTYSEAQTPEEIEPLLRRVVAESSEGLVLKNPRSMYRLNSRNDDWAKVKPEYMSEFGEELDCLVIGGYYGSGHRGGGLSSFLCGLRVDEAHRRQGASPLKCYSFFKVGGGFTAADYANMRHHTEGKWHEWDSKTPPTEYIELAGGDKQYERPDVWIRPDESVVLSVKAASVAGSTSFRMGYTLRFPRFRALRMDRGWDSALSIEEFLKLKSRAEQEQKEKQFKFDEARKAKRPRTKKKKEIEIAGSEGVQVIERISASMVDGNHNLFSGLNFYILTESLRPGRKSKTELEALVKGHGGSIFQAQTAAEKIICIADRNLVKVASLKKAGDCSIIRPSWLFDCVAQNEIDSNLGRTPMLLPYEPRHCLFVAEADQNLIGTQIDEWQDSYARDLSVADLREIFESMPSKFEDDFEAEAFLRELESHGHGFEEQMPGWIFRNQLIYIDEPTAIQTTSDDEMEINDTGPLVCNFDLYHTEAVIKFAGGHISRSLGDPGVTHVVVDATNKGRVRELRQALSTKSRPPRLVKFDWVHESWSEKTLLDAESFIPI